MTASTPGRQSPISIVFVNLAGDVSRHEHHVIVRDNSLRPGASSLEGTRGDNGRRHLD